MTAKPLVRILLIDDHPLVRDGLRARLENEEFFEIAAEAGDAEEACFHARNTAVDLALMDINLREMSGIELTSRFRDVFPKIAVLILSMYDNVEYLTQSIRAGACGYILKDASGDDIISAIKTVMSGGIYYSAALAKKLSHSITPDMLLTARERQVLHHIADGKANKQIADELYLSVRTIETHRFNLKRKLNINGHAELIRFAVKYL